MKFINNPETFAPAGSIVQSYTCGSGAGVGDLVYPSNSVSDFVVTNQDNRQQFPTIGIIVNKPTATTCKILTFGEFETPIIGLALGKVVFVSEVGTPTTTPPSTGYVQQIGFSHKTNMIFISPNFTRTAKNPF